MEINSWTSFPVSETMWVGSRNSQLMVEHIKDLLYILKPKKNYKHIFRTSQFTDFNAWATLHVD